MYIGVFNRLTVPYSVAFSIPRVTNLLHSHVGFEVDFFKGYPQGYVQEVQRAVFWLKRAQPTKSQLNAVNALVPCYVLRYLLPSSLTLNCAQYLNS